MQKTSIISLCAAMILACLILPLPGIAAEESPGVALGTLENAAGDVRFSYLDPIIQGLLLYDLTSRGGLEVVERSRLAAILEEQELTLSGLVDPARALKAGKILQARWLVYGSYSVVDAEVLLTLQLTDAQSGETRAFMERGRSEHVVHLAAERLVKALNGRTVLLADASNDRSIISLRDETPGDLVVHSKIERARIYIDDEFAGFTRGDETVPIVFPHLPPGFHTVRIHLNDDFGAFPFPSLDFRDWEAKVQIRPGRQTAVLDDTRHIADAVRRGQYISGDRITVAPDAPAGLETVQESGYQEPSGRQVRIRFITKLSSDKRTLGVHFETATQSADGSFGPSRISPETLIPLPPESTPMKSGESEFEGIRLKTSINRSSSGIRFIWTLERTDLETVMKNRMD